MEVKKIREIEVRENLENLAPYQIQSRNIQELKIAKKTIIRSINQSIRKSDETGIRINTKILALLFSTYTETLLSKILHSSYGFIINENTIERIRTEIQDVTLVNSLITLKDIKVFAKDELKEKVLPNEINDSILKTILKHADYPNVFSEDEIYEIKFHCTYDAAGILLKNNNVRERNIEEKWKKLLELSLNKFFSSKYSIDVDRNKLQGDIDLYLKIYVIEQSEIRNKIAHGQWILALNSKGNKANITTTNKIKLLNLNDIRIQFDIFDKLSLLIETLVKSSPRTFRRDLEKLCTELNAISTESSKRTFQQTEILLKKRKIKHNNSNI
jgi:hypothetical protein